MIGLLAEVSDDDARPDFNQLESVRWFTRDEIRTMISDGAYDGVLPAPRLAIARHLLEAWVQAGD